ncbi:flagellar export chaperone FlgN [Thalassotalea sp. PLHSN55]|uniref:flagellar export chaperone FlgN n=1 Tax=Thalassotalea sp. PLHSN55 TaxID=3435888 RepID=UPI003F878C46
MSQIKQTIQLLVAGIKEDLTHFQRYHQLLIEQQSLMQQHNSEQLMLLNKRHEKYHHALLQQSNKRKKLLLELGLSADDAGMDAVISALSAKPAAQVQQMWHALKNLVAQCQQQNQRNGELLASQQQLLNKMLRPDSQNEYCPNLA